LISQDLRVQLVQERDTIRHVNLQKEIELKELQSRLDRSVSYRALFGEKVSSHFSIKTQELSKTRESLVGAETSKKHLEERVADLIRQTQGNEEKLAVYERRPAADRGISHNVSPDASREQQLESEVAELR
jgi:nucleoprotein TPR